MDYDRLLDFAADMGYAFSMCGAETYRVETAMSRLLHSYGLECEVFAIPNYLVVSILTDTDKPITRMRRIGPHGTDLDTLDKLNALSRTICASTPAPETAIERFHTLLEQRTHYSPAMRLLGNFLGGAGFCVLFGGSLRDTFCAGLCGLVIGLINRELQRLRPNPLFVTLIAAFAMTVTAYFLKLIGLCRSFDAVNIGALMLLVPGLLFTNAMRDIICGDTNSGINRIVQVVLIATAIALGTGAALKCYGKFFPLPVSPETLSNPLWLHFLAAFLGCIGFSVDFNLYGRRTVLCALGGAVFWIMYLLLLTLGSELAAYFWATAMAALYAEIMARACKTPSISFLVVSIFPMLPGAGIYYTMRYAVQGKMEHFAATGGSTAAIAGTMAIAILLVSTCVQMYSTWKTGRRL